METIDRVQYLHSVDMGSKDFSNALLTYFDQLMGIYGLIQPCNYTVHIVNDTLDGSNVVLDLVFSDESFTTSAINILMSYKRIEIYQRLFDVNIEDKNSNTLRLILVSI